MPSEHELHVGEKPGCFGIGYFCRGEGWHGCHGVAYPADKSCLVLEQPGASRGMLRCENIPPVRMTAETVAPEDEGPLPVLRDNRCPPSKDELSPIEPQPEDVNDEKNIDEEDRCPETPGCKQNCREEQANENGSEDYFHPYRRNPGARIVVLPVEDAEEGCGNGGQEREDYAVACRCREVSSEDKADNPEHEGSNDEPYGQMVENGMHGIGEPYRDKGPVESIHVCPSGVIASF